MYIWTVVVEDLLYIKIRNAVREKNGIMWEKFPSGGPPPQFGNAMFFKKKIWFIFHFKA